MTRPPRAMVLAAGMGSRLGDMGRVRPKPLLPMLDRTLIRWVMTWLHGHGIQDVVVNLHHLGELIREDLDAARMAEIGCADMRIAFSDESGLLLGTGGGLRQASPLLFGEGDADDTPIVVANAKLLLDVDLHEVLTRHRDAATRDGIEATMVLRRDHEKVWGGNLAADARGRLVELLGERREFADSGEVVDACMFTGVHIVTPRFLRRIPAEGEQCVIRTAYRDAFRQGKVGAFVDGNYWWEHSTPQRYLQGLSQALDGRCRLVQSVMAQPIHPSATVASGVEIRGPVYIGDGATIEEGAIVGPYAQIGARAVVRSGVHVERSAVWPDVVVASPVEDAVASN